MLIWSTSARPSAPAPPTIKLVITSSMRTPRRYICIPNFNLNFNPGELFFRFGKGRGARPRARPEFMRAALVWRLHNLSKGLASRNRIPFLFGGSTSFALTGFSRKMSDYAVSDVSDDAYSDFDDEPMTKKAVARKPAVPKKAKVHYKSIPSLLIFVVNRLQHRLYRVRRRMGRV